MTDRKTASTITDTELDALYNELDRLHAGEEDGHVEFTEPTPGQWLWKFNRITPEQRLNVINALTRDAAKGRDCFFMAHEKRAEEDRQAWVALARVRDVIADMEQITGARHWARILRTAIDGEPKQEPAEERVDRLAAALREVLGTFIHETHPGRRCLQSSHVSIGIVERWRAVLDQPKEA